MNEERQFEEVEFDVIELTPKPKKTTISSRYHQGDVKLYTVEESNNIDTIEYDIVETTPKVLRKKRNSLHDNENSESKKLQSSDSSMRLNSSMCESMKVTFKGAETFLDETCKRIGTKSFAWRRLLFENEESRSMDRKADKLFGGDSRLQENIELFLLSFKNSFEFRMKNEQIGFESKLLPDCQEFESYFRKAAQTNKGLGTQMRLAAHHQSTVKRAASSALALMVFLKKPESRVCDYEFGKSIEQNLKTITSMDKNTKSDLIVKFIEWYGSVSRVRKSTTKLVLCNFVEERAKCKENSTLTTVVRGLLAFLTTIGAIEISSWRSPTEESKKIWLCLRETLKLASKTKGGAIRSEQCPLSMTDIVILMKDCLIWENIFSLQAILLVMTLSGSGVRVGSIRNSAVCGRQFFFGNNEDYDDVEEEEGYETEDERYSDDDSEENSDFEEINFDFKFLNSNQVIVYRLPSAQDEIRLEVELFIQSTKTTGNSLFSKQKLGFSFPMLDNENREDWTPNAAVSLCFMSIICGNTNICELLTGPPVEKQKISIYLPNPPPLFRAGTTKHDLENGTPLNNVTSAISLVARKLKLPAALVTSKSCRQGFAKGLVDGFITRKNSQTVVSIDEVKEMLCSSSRWNSAQTKCYIRSITDRVIGGCMTDVGCTAAEWISAIHKSSPWSKQYPSEYATEHNVLSILRGTGEEKVFEKNVKFKERLRFIDMMNLIRWQNSMNIHLTENEISQMKKAKPVLNLRKTLISLARFLTPKTLFGAAKIPLIENEKMRCPVDDCPKPLCTSITQSHEHWCSYHAKSYQSLKYVCQLCDEGDLCGWKNFRRHTLLRHPMEQATFQWVFDETVAE